MKIIVLISLLSLPTMAQFEQEVISTETDDLEVVEFEEISASDVPQGEMVEEVNIGEEEDYLAPFESEETTTEVEPLKNEPSASEPLMTRSSYQLSDPSLSRKSLLFRDKLKIGFDSARWDYEEFVDGQTFMKDGGQLYGVKATVENNLSNESAFWNLSIRYLAGKTLYEGGNTAGEKFNLDSRNSITEFDSNIGYAFSLSSSTFFKPSVGLSYRILSNPRNNYPGSYSREAKYFTVPLKLELAVVTSESFLLSLGTNYHYLLQASTESKLSETTGGVLGDINNEQNKGKGYGAQLNFSWLFKQRNSITFSPYYRVWDFEDSESVLQSVTDGLSVITYGFKEPKNKTQEVGASLSFGF